MNRSLDQAVCVHDLLYLDEGATILVGRTDTDSYAKFPPDGAQLLRRLASGETPRQVADGYERECGQTLNIEDFLETLVSLGFIVQEGDHLAGVKTPPRGHSLGRLLFSSPAWLLYASVVTAAAALLATTPAARPSYQDIFFTPALSAVYLGLMVGQVALCLLHEGFHALAARRIGVRTHTTISRRFIFPVFETRMDGLVGVPRRHRYLPILAGVLADAVAYSSLVLIAVCLDGHSGGAGLIGKFCLGLAFTTLLRIIWQFYFFLQNDGYYLVATALDSSDLHGATMWMLHQWGGAVVRRSRPATPRDNWDPRDLRHARWYAPLVAVGYLLLACSLGLAVVPTARHVWHLISDTVLNWRSDSTLQMLDTSLCLAILSAQLIVPVLLFLRSITQPIRLTDRSPRE